MTYKTFKATSINKNYFSSINIKQIQTFLKQNFKIKNFSSDATSAGKTLLTPQKNDMGTFDLWEMYRSWNLEISKPQYLQDHFLAHSKVYYLFL